MPRLLELATGFSTILDWRLDDLWILLGQDLNLIDGSMELIQMLKNLSIFVRSQISTLNGKYQVVCPHDHGPKSAYTRTPFMAHQ